MAPAPGKRPAKSLWRASRSAGLPGLCLGNAQRGQWARSTWVEAVRLAVGALGCAFTPPPRFVFVGPSPGGDIGTWYEFHRLSFSGTDGIDRLLVIETKERLKVDDPDGLFKRAVALSRKIHIEADVHDVECRADSVAENQRAAIHLRHLEGQGDAGALRSTMCWFLDEGGRLSCMSIGTTTAQSSGMLVEELQAALSSWRRTRNRPSRPWWKPWA